jgi:Putative Actinobacterial Holin-X, holin superfamily III
MNDVQTAPPGQFTELVRGIVNDIGDLIRQEVRFARTEVKSDLRKAKAALVLLACGAAIAAVGGILLSLMIVHLIHWLSVPPDRVLDPARIPLWGCYGLTALLFLGAGGGLVWGGLKRFEANNPLPDQTIRSVEENVSWIAQNSTRSASSK